MTTRSVTVTREMPFPPDRVWRALTSPHLIAEWLMKNDFAPVLGHGFTLTGDWGSVQCQVRAVDPPRVLSYTWDHPSETPAYDLRSTVTFTLEPTATGTRITMEQAGFRPDQPQAYGGALYGWQEHLANLEKAVART